MVSSSCHTYVTRREISSDMYTQRPSLFISAQILHTTYYVSLF
jgi:hypothetical protein